MNNEYVKDRWNYFRVFITVHIDFRLLYYIKAFFAESHLFIFFFIITQAMITFII